MAWYEWVRRLSTPFGGMGGRAGAQAQARGLGQGRGEGRGAPGRPALVSRGADQGWATRLDRGKEGAGAGRAGWRGRQGPGPGGGGGGGGRPPARLWSAGAPTKAGRPG